MMSSVILSMIGTLVDSESEINTNERAAITTAVGAEDAEGKREEERAEAAVRGTAITCCVVPRRRMIIS
jgi:hypothetical protein